MCSFPVRLALASVVVVVLFSALCSAECGRNCVDCRGDNCVRCADGYSLNSNTCAPLTMNCVRYSNVGICTACSSGYILKQIREPGAIVTTTECMSVGTRNCQIANCKECLYDSCVRCNTGYQIEAGLCVAPIPNCVHFSSAGVCDACQVGYTLKQGVIPGGRGVSTRCVSSVPSGTCTRPNCLNCAAGPCTQCAAGYGLSNGSCRPQLSNCRQYLRSGACAACKRGYKLERVMAAGQQKPVLSCIPRNAA